MIHLRLFLLGSLAVAHGNHAHVPKPAQITAPAPQVQRSADELINQRYQLEIQPIFEKKCFDCHSSKTVYPWYHKVPGIQQLIDSDISDAKDHLDLDPGFPFKSHASPQEDLKAIAEEVADNEMPPLSYKLMHRDSGLTKEEKEKVQAWVQFGLQHLQK